MIRNHDLALVSQDRRRDPEPPSTQLEHHTPKGIRTPVAGLKSRCPGPLDDGGQARRIWPGGVRRTLALLRAGVNAR